MFHLYHQLHNQWPRRYAYACGYSKGVSASHYQSRGHRRSGMGVRRPLRYLSYHLELDENQRRKVAASLERIKLEREQASLDHKRADASVADEFLRADASTESLKEALAPNLESAANMQQVIAEELASIAAVLHPDQREEFAHLLRRGTLKL